MEIILIIIAIVLIIFVTQNSASSKNSDPKEINYGYVAKNHIMTPAEEKFFNLLQDTVSDKYYVFPQIHLSALLDHRVKGQNWKGAFAHINSKSVDYVLCDKQTLKPVYAIELDDYTHKREDRIARDTKVEEIFSKSGVCLVRFSNGSSLSSGDIITKLSEANQNSNM